MRLLDRRCLDSQDRVMLSNLSPGNSIIVPPSGHDDTAAILAACQVVKTRGLAGVAHLVEGTYYVRSIPLPARVSLQGAGIDATRIKMLPGANSDAVVETEGFAQLDAAGSYGTESAGPSGGTYRSRISDLVIDGNRSQNSRGRGLQLYGKGFSLQNLGIENCADDGLYTGYNGVDDFWDPEKTLEANVTHLTIQQCGDKGWLFNGPHDSEAFVVRIFRVDDVAWDVRQAIGAYGVNTYLARGGIHVHERGLIGGSKIIGAGFEFGGLFESGHSVITASSWGGGDATHEGVGLEVRSGPLRIDGIIANSRQAAFRLNGLIAGGKFDLTIGGGCPGVWVDNGPTYPQVHSDITITSGQTDGRLFNGGAYERPFGVTRVVANGKTGTYYRTGDCHVVFEYVTASAQALADGAFTVVDFATKRTSTVGDRVTTGVGWQFAAPSTGHYRLSTQAISTGTPSAFFVSAFVNGVEVRRSGNGAINTTVALAKDDVLDVRVFVAGTGHTLVPSAAANWIYVEKAATV